MPRKSKETPEKIESVEKKETKKVARSTKKVARSTKKVASSSKTAIKKSTSKAEKESTSAKKNTTSKITTKTKKEPTKKVTNTKPAKNSTVKASTKSKQATPKTSTKKSTTNSRKAPVKKAATLKKEITTAQVPEYYDLPYHYNQTVVKVLAQTPKTLFVYWDVSEEDRQALEKQFGPDFFNHTIPFLRVKNETRHSSFDIDVDDFANGWYIQVEDAKCDYSIELLRKQRPYVTKVIDSPVYITSSNQMETPNDHILFDCNRHTIYYRNVKTNKITTKNIAQLAFLRKIGKIYNIYDFYKQIYKNEDISEIFDLNNPSSGNPTSTFH